MRHTAHALDNFAGKATHAKLQALDVSRRLDLFAKPATHLRAGVTAQHIDDVVFGIKLAHQLAAIAIDYPCSQLAGIHAKRNGTANSKSLVFTEEIVRRSVGHLHRAVLHAIDHTKRWHQLACSVYGDFKFSARHLLHSLGKNFCRAINRVQRLGETRCQAPAHCGLGVYRRCDACSQHTRNTSLLDEGTTIHDKSPNKDKTTSPGRGEAKKTGIPLAVAKIGGRLLAQTSTMQCRQQKNCCLALELDSGHVVVKTQF